MMKLHSWLFVLPFIPLAAGAATISGTISGRTGTTGPTTPLAGAEVVLINTTGGAHLDSVATDPTGHYSFTDTSLGARRIQASLAGYTSNTGNVTVASDTVSYTVNMTLEAIVPPGGITGVVKDSANHLALAGARIILTHAGGGTAFAPETLTTNAQGQYTFDSIAANTGYSLNATATGYEALTRAGVTVVGDSTTTENLTMLLTPVPGGITGVVKDSASQQAISGARIILTHAGGGAAFAPETLTTSAQGQYTFASIPVNTGYSLNASATGYETLTRTGVSVATGVNTTENLTMLLIPPPGGIAGLVKDSLNQQALVGARVILTHAGGGAAFAPETLTTNAQGQYAFDSIPDNTGYTLNGTATGFEALTQTGVTVAGGATTTENLALLPIPAPGGISGTISDRVTQQALAGARVILTHAGGGTAFAPETLTTNAQGQYAFDSVAVNTGYSLAVTDSGYQAVTQTGVAVTTGHTTTENLTMAPNGVTSGQLLGTVTNGSNQEAIASARVILSRTGGGGGAFAPETLTTNAQGVYHFDSVTASNTAYTVTVTAAGLQREAKTATIVAAETDTVNFMLVDTGAANTGSVNGLVLGSSNQILSNARVVLSSTGGGGAVRDTVQTNAQGYYVITGLAAGNYTMTVTDSGYQNSPATVVAVTAGTTSETDFTLSVTTAILPGPMAAKAWSERWNGEMLELDFSASNQARFVQVFSLNGSMLHRVVLPAGETRLLLPADVKPSEHLFLRVTQGM